LLVELARAIEKFFDEEESDEKGEWPSQRPHHLKEFGLVEKAPRQEIFFLLGQPLF